MELPQVAAQASEALAPRKVLQEHNLSNDENIGNTRPDPNPLKRPHSPEAASQKRGPAASSFQLVPPTAGLPTVIDMQVTTGVRQTATDINPGTLNLEITILGGASWQTTLRPTRFQGSSTAAAAAVLGKWSHLCSLLKLQLNDVIRFTYQGHRFPPDSTQPLYCFTAEKKKDRTLCIPSPPTAVEPPTAAPVAGLEAADQAQQQIVSSEGHFVFSVDVRQAIAKYGFTINQYHMKAITGAANLGFPLSAAVKIELQYNDGSEVHTVATALKQEKKRLTGRLGSEMVMRTLFGTLEPNTVLEFFYLEKKKVGSASVHCFSVKKQGAAIAIEQVPAPAPLRSLAPSATAPSQSQRKTKLSVRYDSRPMQKSRDPRQALEANVANNAAPLDNVAGLGADLGSPVRAKRFKIGPRDNIGVSDMEREAFEQANKDEEILWDDPGLGGCDDFGPTNPIAPELATDLLELGTEKQGAQEEDVGKGNEAGNNETNMSGETAALPLRAAAVNKDKAAAAAVAVAEAEQDLSEPEHALNLDPKMHLTARAESLDVTIAPLGKAVGSRTEIEALKAELAALTKRAKEKFTNSKADFYCQELNVLNERNKELEKKAAKAEAISVAMAHQTANALATTLASLNAERVKSAQAVQLATTWQAHVKAIQQRLVEESSGAAERMAAREHQLREEFNSIAEAIGSKVNAEREEAKRAAAQAAEESAAALEEVQRQCKLEAEAALAEAEDKYEKECFAMMQDMAHIINQLESTVQRLRAEGAKSAAECERLREEVTEYQKRLQADQSRLDTLTDTLRMRAETLQAVAGEARARAPPLQPSLHSTEDYSEHRVQIAAPNPLVPPPDLNVLME